jgi:hypothetical protein
MALTRNEGTSYIDAGLSRRDASLGGMLGYKVGTFNTPGVSGSFQTVASISIPRNCLNSNLKSLRVNAWGSALNNANAKAAQIIVTQAAGTIILAALTITASVLDNWTLYADLVRTGVATQIFRGEGYNGVVGTGSATSSLAVGSGTFFSIQAMVVSLQLQTPTATADVTGNALSVELDTEGSIPPL